MKREMVIFLTAVIVVISVIGVSTTVLSKALTKPTSENYKQEDGFDINSLINSLINSPLPLLIGPVITAVGVLGLLPLLAILPIALIAPLVALFI